MNEFVREKNRGAASPQNGSQASYQLAAAQLKVRPGDARNYQKSNSSRAYNTGEHPSTLKQPHQQQPQPHSIGQQGYDAYGTDAASIDSTNDRSTVRLGDDQIDRNQDVEASDTKSGSGQYDEEENSENSQDPDGFQNDDQPEFKQEEITTSDEEFFVSNNLQNHPPAVQMQILRHYQDEKSFAYGEGDSYPSTTDGEPSEMQDSREPLSGVENYGTQGMTTHEQYRTNQPVGQSFQHQAFYRDSSPRVAVAGYSKPVLRSIIREGADIREQERGKKTADLRNGVHHHGNTAAQPSHHEAGYNLGPSNPRQNPTRDNALPEWGSAQLPQIPQVVIPDSRNIAAFTHTGVIRNGQQVANTVDGDHMATIYDYNRDVLAVMSYDQLKGESFDTDPRVESPALSEDMRNRALQERLVFVRQNLDAEKKSMFFNSLSTSEWEDAGDWFLEQFSSVIKRSREARQKKRKLACEFEDEVEKRHQHVSKKQLEVEAAMAKMKAQGEGLVPRSPRAPKTPKPRRG